MDLLFTVVSSFELAATNAASVEAPPKVQCGQCPLFRDRITSLEEDIEEISLQENEIRVKLEASRSALATSIERETELKYVGTMNRTVLMMCTAKVIKLSVLMRHFLICCCNVLFGRREEKEQLCLKEAQVRYELDQLSKKLVEQSERNDKENEQQIQSMEQVSWNKSIFRDVRKSKSALFFRS